MTTYGLVLIVVALGCVVVMFAYTLELRTQRDAAQAYMQQVRSELEAARLRRRLQEMIAPNGGAK